MSCGNEKYLRAQQLSNDCKTNRKNADYWITLEQIDKNSQQKSFLRAVQILEHEQQIEEQIMKEQKVMELTKERIDKEERLAKEMEEIKRSKILEDRMRQSLRESSQELKSLEVKLRSAYVLKGLIAQKTEKEQLALQEKIDKKNEEALLLQARIDYEAFERSKLEQEKHKQFVLRAKLREQMDEKITKKQLLYVEFLKEKRYIDEVIRRISEEQIEELKAKLIKRNNFISGIEKIVAANEVYKEKRRREIEQENQRIAEYLEEKAKKLKEEIEKAKEQKLLQYGRVDKMVAELTAEMDRARKHEELLIDLKIQELDAIEEEKEMKAIEIELRKRIELRFKLDQQKHENQLKAKEQQEEDRRFREEQMIYLAERDKIDQLSDEKKLRKKLEHRKAIQECLEAKRLERAEKVAKLLKAREMNEKSEQRKQELIEEERIRMLKEHAAALIGFFPPGILRESDREFLPLPPKRD